MFPKHKVATVAIPPEKPPLVDQKDSAVVFMVDSGDLQVTVDNDRQWRTKKAVICACVFVLTILILVAGTLGAIAIVLIHRDRAATSVTQSPRDSFIGNALPTDRPKTSLRIKIDDDGLWLAGPVTPDLVDVEYVTNDPTVSISDSFASIPGSSSESEPSSSSEEDYNLRRNWVSSSFPYDGYYMRGAVGMPPWWENGEKDEPSDEKDEPSDVSGDGGDVSGEGALSDQEIGDEPDYYRSGDQEVSDVIAEPDSSSSDGYNPYGLSGISDYYDDS